MAVGKRRVKLGAYTTGDHGSGGHLPSLWPSEAVVAEEPSTHQFRAGVASKSPKLTLLRFPRYGTCWKEAEWTGC